MQKSTLNTGVISQWFHQEKKKKVNEMELLDIYQPTQGGLTPVV